MTQSQFDYWVNQLNLLADTIVNAKRPDYTREQVDILANFKETAASCGITPLQVWLVHFYKQYSAVARFVSNPKCTPSEPIDNRFADIRNYIHLGFALFKEWERKTTETLDGKGEGNKKSVHEVAESVEPITGPVGLVPPGF